MNQHPAQLDNVEFDNQHPSHGNSRAELLLGLQQQQKTVNPKYFYDTRGSELFERITRLPEYYPTRTEVDILQNHCEEIASFCGRGCVFIEPGSGAMEKVRLLLHALTPQVYVPLDISADFLYQSALQLGAEFPWLKIHAICADFSHNWTMPATLPAGKRVVFYPGSTIGNLESIAATAFLRRLRQWMQADGGVLIGVDLHKPEQRLNAAYNDAEGVTAEFNLNLLDCINPLLDAEFDRSRFSHRAFYNNSLQRIEMHLVSKQAHSVRCNGEVIHFAEGESIHTENSYKYTEESFANMAAATGLIVRHSWLDRQQLFSVHYLEQQ